MTDIPTVAVRLDDFRKLLTLAGWAKQNLSAARQALGDVALESALNLDTRALADNAQRAAGLRDPQMGEPLTASEYARLAALAMRIKQLQGGRVHHGQVLDALEPDILDHDYNLWLVSDPIMQSLRLKGAVAMGARNVIVKFSDKTQDAQNTGEVLWKITTKGYELLKKGFDNGNARGQPERQARQPTAPDTQDLGIAAGLDADAPQARDG